jgi:hypothetical protein
MIIVETQFQLDEEKETCIVTLPGNVDEQEDAELLDYLQEIDFQEMYGNLHKFIAVVPDPFLSCESFRINIHRYLLNAHQQHPEFVFAVVTTLMNIVGYEQFAKTVIQMVKEEQIFETLEDAQAWIDAQP